MHNRTRLGSVLAALGVMTTASATVVDFTGGTVYFNGGGTAVPANNASYNNVDYYDEGGFRLDFIGGVNSPFSAHVGTYYGVPNDVIHSHWSTGNYGTITLVQGSKIGGGTFDLNYFILTSNTDFGGGAASGNEQAYITHDGGLDPIRLPSENWGFPATQIFLPSSYDSIATFEFTVQNKVDCFGMDEFYINEPPPPHTPDASRALPLMLLGVLGVAACHRRVR